MNYLPYQNIVLINPQYSMNIYFPKKESLKKKSLKKYTYKRDIMCKYCGQNLYWCCCHLNKQS